MQGWIDLFRGLGESLLTVLRAEVATLQEDLSRSGRIAGGALALLGVALILLFWILGLVIFTAVVVLAIWLPLWGASLVVLGLFLVAAGLLGWMGTNRLKQVENPVDTFRRRVDDHLDWWQNTLLRETRPVDVAPVSRDLYDDVEEDMP